MGAVNESGSLRDAGSERVYILNIYEVISAAACIVFLLPCTVSDLRRQRISVPLLSAAAAASLVFALWKAAQGEETASALFLSVMPGIFLLLVAGVTSGGVGIGDGVVFAVIGLLIGCWNAFAVMFIALVLSAIYGGSLMLRGKAGHRTGIAWMPFVLAGAGLWAGLSIWQRGLTL